MPAEGMTTTRVMGGPQELSPESALAMVGELESAFNTYEAKRNLGNAKAQAKDGADTMLFLSFVMPEIIRIADPVLRRYGFVASQSGVITFLSAARKHRGEAAVELARVSAEAASNELAGWKGGGDGETLTQAQATSQFDDRLEALQDLMLPPGVEVRTATLGTTATTTVDTHHS